MKRLRTAGVALAALAVGGYAVGITTPYPGRSLSVTLFLVGATLAGVGGGAEG